MQTILKLYLYPCLSATSPASNILNLHSLDHDDSQDNEASPRKLANQHHSTNYSEEKLFLLKKTILEAF